MPGDDPKDLTKVNAQTEEHSSSVRHMEEPGLSTHRAQPKDQHGSGGNIRTRGSAGPYQGREAWAGHLCPDGSQLCGPEGLVPELLKPGRLATASFQS